MIFRLLFFSQIILSQPVFKNIAVTIDDLPLNVAQKTSNVEMEKIVEQLTALIQKEKIPVTAFVNENKLELNGKRDPERVAILTMWMQENVELGNHTYAHKSLNRISVQEGKEDILLGDRTIRELLSAGNKVPRYFRHPFLHTGRDSSMRSSINTYLDSLGYAVVPVTIDNAEWIFAAAFDKMHHKNDSASMKRVGEEYITYMRAKLRHYENISDSLFGRNIRQILLIHSNRLNAQYFSTLCSMIREEGYSFISVAEAMNDDAYRSPDSYFGAGGISWLDRWALTAGKKGTFFSNDPKTPKYIMELAGVESE